jgi:hypothetical protein
VENNIEDDVSDKQIQFINILAETATILEQKIKSSEFITNIILSLFDKDLIEDLTQMKEFLNDLKQEVRELREEYLELESEHNGKNG